MSTEFMVSTSRTTPFTSIPTCRSSRLRHRHYARPLYAATAASTTGSTSITTLEDTIIVAGGGPAGLATALALQKVGIPAIVLEKGSEPSNEDNNNNVSTTTTGTALGLWTNAWRALDALGAADYLRNLHPTIADVELCRDSGKKLTSFNFKQCSGGPHEFRGVRRSNLVAALKSQLKENSIIYDSEVLSVRAPRSGSLPSLGAEAILTDGSVLQCRALIGADGVRSNTALSSGLRGPVNYAGQVAIRGIAHFPQGVPSKGKIRQILGAGVRAGMYNISDTELYWFVVMYAAPDAPIPPNKESIKLEALNAVKGWADASCIPAAIEATPLIDLSRSRIVDRWDLPSNIVSDGINTPIVTLAGDSLHPMTPNLGQGGCTALEDAVVLARVLKSEGLTSTSSSASSLAYAFKEYEKQRVKRCLPLTVRAYAMGTLLQLGFLPVVVARDAFISNAFDPSHFLDHASFDCGKL